MLRGWRRGSGRSEAPDGPKHTLGRSEWPVRYTKESFLLVRHKRCAGPGRRVTRTPNGSAAVEGSPATVEDSQAADVLASVIEVRAS